MITFKPSTNMFNHPLNGGNSLEPSKEYFIIRSMYPLVKMVGITKKLKNNNIPNINSLFGLDNG